MDTIGLDLHKRESQLCIGHDDGSAEERRIATSRERFTAVLGGRPLLGLRPPPRAGAGRFVFAPPTGRPSGVTSGCRGRSATAEDRGRPKTPTIMASVLSPSTMRASTWVALLPLRRMRACARTSPPGTGARKVTCSERSGASGAMVRIAASPTTACKPPKSVRPCNQSSGTSSTDVPSPAWMRESRIENGVMVCSMGSAKGITGIIAIVITVHHLNNSRSHRIVWLLEELGVPYEIKRYQRDPKTSLAPPELLRVHPLGKSPVITDGDLTIAESGAIIEYLVDRYGKGALIPPPGTPERLRYTYWLHFAEGTAMPPLVMKLVFNRVEKGPMPFFARPIARAIAKKVKGGFIDPNLERIVAHIESELGRSDWFAGDAFTAADIQMSFPVEAAAARVGKPPAMSRFLERIHARPAYQRAIEKGGELAILA